MQISHFIFGEERKTCAGIAAPRLPEVEFEGEKHTFDRIRRTGRNKFFTAFNPK